MRKSAATVLLLAALWPKGVVAAPPVFTSSTVTRTVAENVAANQDIGSAVSATDPDAGQTLTYTLGGADAASRARTPPSSASRAVLADRNGVPRARKFVPALRGFTRFFRDSALPYAYAQYNTPGERWSLLDKDLTVRWFRLGVVSPLRHTDPHDFLLTPNGEFLFMSYEWSRRDFSFPSTELGLQKKVEPGVPDGAGNADTARPCRAADTGCVAWSEEDTRDSAIQLRTRRRAALLNWNSWGNMAIEDCLTHRIPWPATS